MRIAVFLVLAACGSDPAAPDAMIDGPVTCQRWGMAATANVDGAATNAKEASPSVAGDHGLLAFTSTPGTISEIYTLDQNVRHCSACKQNVYHCTSVPDARAHAERGECVALDLTAQRWSDDLDAPYRRNDCRWCRADLGTFSGESCPRCGGTMRPMTVGRIAPR